MEPIRHIRRHIQLIRNHSLGRHRSSRQQHSHRRNRQVRNRNPKEQQHIRRHIQLIHSHSLGLYCHSHRTCCPAVRIRHLLIRNRSLGQ